MPGRKETGGREGSAAASTRPGGRGPGDAQPGDSRPGVALRDLLFNRSSLILFLLALGFRLLYLAEYQHSPFWCLLFGDPQLYHQRGIEILKGDFLGQGVSFHSSPLYPYFLALVYRLFGVSIPAVFIVQAVIGAADAVIVALCARLLFGAAAFWITGAAVSFWPLLAYFNAEQLEITLVLAGVHLMLLLLILEREGRRRTLFPAGLFLGLAVLGKPNSALFLLFWFLWEWRRARRPGGTRAPLALAFRRTLPLLLGVLCLVAPFTVRNLAVNHDFVLTSANGGINLFIGNNPQARGVFQVPNVLQGDLYESSRRVAENDLMRPLKASEVSDYWTRRALAWIEHAPGAFLLLTGRKILLLMNGLEISNHFDPNFLARDVLLLRVSPFRFGLWLPFAFWGAIAAAAGRLRPPRRSPWDIPLLWIAAYAVSLVPFFMTARYRIPIVPALLVFASAGILDLYERIRSRRFDRILVLGLASVAVVLGIAHLPLNRAQSFYFAQYQILGAAARDRGDLEAAVRYYTEAARLEPRSVIAHNSLATCLARLGRSGEAATHLEQAVRLDPAYPIAWRNLALVRRAQGDRTSEREALERAVSLDPRFRQAREDLVRVLIEGQDYPAALAQVDAMLRIDPRDSSALWNRVVLLGRFLGRKEEALQALDRLESFGPSDKERSARDAEMRRFLEKP